MTAPAPVSFTVRRPSPISRGASSGPDSDGSSFKVPALPRHLTREDSKLGSPLGRSSPAPKKSQSRTYDERDSSDEESDDGADELVTGFDQFGVQRAVERKKPEGPLVIAPLKNRDWREVARKRRTTERFVPGAGKAATGADGSVGGLGTRGSINSGPQLVGLQKRVKREHDGDMDIDSAPNSGFATPAEESGTESVKKEDTESEEQRALRALLKGATGDGDDAFAIPAIPINPLSEEEALRQDVAELPEESSLADYERVPVSQFGAAMLRGMGWKPEVEQKSTGKAGRRPAQPWVPEQRPALLGIGAKEREVLDDGGPKKFMGGKKAQMKYMPLVKREREGSSSGGDRDRGDRSRDEKDSRVSGRDERDRDGDRREGRERDYSSSDRDRDRGKDRRESRDDRNIHGRRDRDQDSDRGHDDRDRRRDTRRDDVRRDYDKRDRRADERGSDGYRSRDGKRDRSRERDRRR